MIELKPCPLCGRQPTAINDKIRCENCCLEIDIYKVYVNDSNAFSFEKARKIAIQNWNNRSDDWELASLKKQVDYLINKDKKEDEVLHVNLKTENFNKGLEWALNEVIARIKEIKEEQL